MTAGGTDAHIHFIAPWQIDDALHPAADQRQDHGGADGRSERIHPDAAADLHTADGRSLSVEYGNFRQRGCTK